ncbi:MAG: zinc ribbon domain-containing protein [Chloroflexi bacterium]|nr:zinc ribbon domain-containing protein [Chloroflexota bacterium]
MPIYAYHCKDCEEPFELFVRSVSATVQPVCPKCGSEHVAKEVSAVSTVGAGGGGGAPSAAACAPSG